jgi:hypothetical protein
MVKPNSATGSRMMKTAQARVGLLAQPTLPQPGGRQVEAVAAGGGERRVGRRQKLYHPSALDLRVNIPARQHDELAEILIDAVLTEKDGESARQAALRVAQARGQTLGAGAQARPGRLGAWALNRP